MFLSGQVFQRRLDGSVDFYEDWVQYRRGFGNVSEEHWLGNRHVHAMTTAHGKQLLRIELTSYSGGTRYAEYTDFALDSEAELYTLRIGVYRDRSDAGQWWDMRIVSATFCYSNMKYWFMKTNVCAHGVRMIYVL